MADTPNVRFESRMSADLDDAFERALHRFERWHGLRRPRVPLGGYKASGIGRRNGHAGFDQYTELKSVAYPVG